jgi:hypothetical protein
MGRQKILANQGAVRRRRAPGLLPGQWSMRFLMLLTVFGPPLLATAWMYSQWPSRQRWTAHFTAGACFAVLYPLAVLIVAAVLQALPWPPERRPLTRMEVAAIVAALLVAINAAVFLVTGIASDWH